MSNTGLIAMVASVLLLAGCSHEKADWKGATTADSTEAYQQFLKAHPASSNAAAAQARLKGLMEDRDWQAAAATDTRAAYEQFIAQHADSKWVQEARIRIENFAQGGSGGTTTTVMNAPQAAPPTASPPANAPSAKVNASAPKLAPSSRVAAAGTHAHTAGSHGNYVQLGAFSSRERAQSQWKTLAAKFPTELKSLQPDIVPGTSRHGTVYRLRVPVSSVAAAKGLCGALKKHAQLCVPVTA